MLMKGGMLVQLFYYVLRKVDIVKLLSFYYKRKQICMLLLKVGGILLWLQLGKIK